MNRVSHSSVKAKKVSDEACADLMDDFETIEQAVMATPRGRWFLAEYLRRRQSAETRRMMEALERLQHAAPVPDFTEGLRLLLAQAADELARELRATAEPTLPEAACGRLAELLHEARAVAERDQNAAHMLLARLADTLGGMLRKMALMLGEPLAQARPDALVEDVAPIMASSAPCPAPPGAAPSSSAGKVPDSTETPSASGASGTAGNPEPRTTEAANKAQRQRRIIIHKHGRSRELDIPLPEGGEDERKTSEKSRRKGLVRIR